jgi:hypothetical protein
MLLWGKPDADNGGTFAHVITSPPIILGVNTEVNRKREKNAGEARERGREAPDRSPSRPAKVKGEDREPGGCARTNTALQQTQQSRAQTNPARPNEQQRHGQHMLGRAMRARRPEGEPPGEHPVTR